MSQIVHITFEKLTGLKGEINGDFIAYNYGLWSPMVDLSLPVVFLTSGPNGDYTDFVFRQNEKYFALRPANQNAWSNYQEHFTYGVNFLIKEWSYGSGVDTGSKNPN